MTREELYSIQVGDTVRVMPYEEIQSLDDFHYRQNPPPASHCQRCGISAKVVEICIGGRTENYEYLRLEYEDGFQWSWYAACLNVERPSIPLAKFETIMS